MAQKKRASKVQILATFNFKYIDRSNDFFFFKKLKTSQIGEIKNKVFFWMLEVEDLKILIIKITFFYS